MREQADTDLTAGDTQAADLVEVGDYPSETAGAQHGLVILAMGLPYWLVPGETRFHLQVERAAAGAARDELARFDRESLAWPPPPVPPSPGFSPRRPVLTPLCWALVVLGAFWAQRRVPWLTPLALLDAELLFGAGEWWRPATALFLHGDTGHLVSNLIPGVFVFMAVLATFGTRRGWMLLLGSAVTANVASAAIHLPGPYRSVGASTAIFAGLGLLTGHAAGRARALRGRRRWQGVFVPLGAGAVLFALYGAGTPRVDLGAHVAGFLTGLGAGLLTCRRQGPSP